MCYHFTIWGGYENQVTSQRLVAVPGRCHDLIAERVQYPQQIRVLYHVTPKFINYHGMLAGIILKDVPTASRDEVGPF